MFDTVLYKLVPQEFILKKHSSKTKVVVLGKQVAFMQ